MPVLLDLPSEVVLLITDFVDQKDFMNLRLTCKPLCAAATKPFVVAYFTERNHIISPYSLRELVRITAHPFFGPYVRTVIISGISKESRRFQSDNFSQIVCDNSVNPGQFWRLIKQAFKNIRKYTNVISVGVCIKNTSKTFGRLELMLRRHYFREYQVASILTRILEATRRNGLITSCVSVDVGHKRTAYMLDCLNPMLQRFIQSALDHNNNNNNNNITTGSTKPIPTIVLHGYGEERVNYSADDGTLELVKLQSPGSPDDARPGLMPLQPPSRWLSSLPISQLSLQSSNLFAFGGVSVEQFASITTLHLNRVFTTVTEAWGVFFRMLSEETRSLKYCQVSNLGYLPGYYEAPVEVRLPSGASEYTVEGVDVSSGLRLLSLHMIREGILQEQAEKLNLLHVFCAALE